MVSIFEKIEISRIQFQEGDREVVVNCKITQNGESTETTLWITFSDLNRILSRIECLNSDTDSSLFKTIYMGNNEMFYECDSKNFGLDSFMLEELYFQQPIRQIRA